MEKEINGACPKCNQTIGDCKCTPMEEKINKLKEIRDWAEDFSHENGNYQNTCIHCEQFFIGHKRRVVCKYCNNLLVDQRNSTAKSILDEIKLNKLTSLDDSPKEKHYYKNGYNKAVDDLNALLIALSKSYEGGE